MRIIINMNNKEMSSRIELLAKDKTTFIKYVDFYHSKEIFFGPSVYFYRKVFDLVRANDLSLLLKSNNFIEYIYATLSSWGMHRMGPKGSKMRKFEDFRDSILSNTDLLLKLKNYRLDALNDENKEKTMSLLGKLFKNLKVMHSGSNLVGNSKVVHYLLPDLVPPIDRQYTLRFFYGSLTSKNTPPFNSKDEPKIFLDVTGHFHTICKKLNLTENDYDKKVPFNTSIPKIIDNAIIGFIRSQ